LLRIFKVAEDFLKLLRIFRVAVAVAVVVDFYPSPWSVRAARISVT
jgi:hypothetical protein